MSLTSPDARAVVAAVDRLTTQVKRLADGVSTPVVVGEMETVGTCDASTHGLGAATLGPCLLRSGHDGPVHRGPDGETWATVDAAADAPTTTADDGPTRLPPAVYDAALRAARLQDSTAPADEEQERTARREQLHNLLARLDRGGLLSPGDHTRLRTLVDAEVREAETVRVKAGDLVEAYKAERRRGDALAEERNQAWAERDAEQARLRDLLRSENQRANKAIERETTAEQDAEEQRQRADIAETELRVLRAGLRANGADPTQIQNLWAQIRLRNGQWRDAKRELEQAQDAIKRVRAVAADIARSGWTGSATARRISEALGGTDQPEEQRCKPGPYDETEEQPDAG